MKSPLVDIAAILMCILLVVLAGQYYIHKKQNEVFQIPMKVESKSEVKQKVDMSRFETASKRTE